MWCVASCSTYRHLPPGRKSISHTGIVNCRSPYQRFTCSGFESASNSSARGALNSRVITSSVSEGMVSVARGLLVVVTVLLLLLELDQKCVELFEPLFPIGAEPLDPLSRFLERLGPQPARPPLRFAPLRHQPGTLEDFEVLRHGRQAQVERLGKLIDRRVTLNQAGQNGAARRIGESAECEAELVGHVYYTNWLISLSG